MSKSEDKCQQLTQCARYSFADSSLGAQACRRADPMISLAALFRTCRVPARIFAFGGSCRIRASGGRRLLTPKRTWWGPSRTGDTRNLTPIGASRGAGAQHRLSVRGQCCANAVIFAQQAQAILLPRRHSGWKA